VGSRRGRTIEADAAPGAVPIELDGDAVGALPARIELVPGALSVIGRRVSLFDAVRSACARVAERARFVRIDEAGLARWVDANRELAPPAAPTPRTSLRRPDDARSPTS
jgi:hypothetical protein